MKIKRAPMSKADRLIAAIPDVIRPKNMVTMSREIDASAMDRLREHYVISEKVKPSYTTLVVRAASLILQRHPYANRKIFGFPFFSRLYHFESNDVSVTIDRSDFDADRYCTTQNLIFRKADGLRMEAISSTLKAVASNPYHESWEAFNRTLMKIPTPIGKLIMKWSFYLPSLWVRHIGSACCVNSPARDGADLVLTNWPFPLSFSFGLVTQRPIVVDNGHVEARRTVPLIMQFDRRIMGGGPASRVFADFISLLENADKNDMDT